MLLDVQLRLITYLEPFRGTLSQAPVYPREILKLALRHNAAGLMMAHNHPSGLAEASQADRQLNQAVKQALALIDVRLLDNRSEESRVGKEWVSTGSTRWTQSM